MKDFSTVITLLFWDVREDISFLKLNIKGQFRCPRLPSCLYVFIAVQGSSSGGNQIVNETKMDVQETKISEKPCKSQPSSTLAWQGTLFITL